MTHCFEFNDPLQNTKCESTFKPIQCQYTHLTIVPQIAMIKQQNDLKKLHEKLSSHAPWKIASNQQQTQETSSHNNSLFEELIMHELGHFVPFLKNVQNV